MPSAPLRFALPPSVPTSQAGVSLGGTYPRSVWIDVIRGFSVVSVILLHINIRIPFAAGPVGASLPKAVRLVLFWSGFYGVTAFFVVSGFLITANSLKRWQSLNRVPIRQFYRFRFARIGPPLFLLLVALSCLHLAGIQGFVINPARATLSQALTAALTFRVNVLQARVGELPACWNVLWTLSIEEVFYIAFPLVCRLLGSERQVVFVLLCLIVAGPFARVLGPHKTDPQDQTYLCCMDGIAFGCLAAIFVWRVRLKPLALRCLLGTGLAAIILIDVFRTQTVQLGLVSTGLYVTVLEIGVSLIVIALWSGAVPTSFGWKPHLLTFFGRNSYEIYLTHSFVVVALTRLYRWQIPGREMVLPWYFAILALSGGVGYMLARLYSIPLNDLLRQHRK